jgi:hypothetical protein
MYAKKPYKYSFVKCSERSNTGYIEWGYPLTNGKKYLVNNGHVCTVTQKDDVITVDKIENIETNEQVNTLIVDICNCHDCTCHGGTKLIEVGKPIIYGYCSEYEVYHGPMIRDTIDQAIKEYCDIPLEEHKQKMSTIAYMSFGQTNDEIEKRRRLNNVERDHFNDFIIAEKTSNARKEILKYYGYGG